MMAEIVVGQNSYVTVEEFQGFATARGATLEQDASVLLIRAVDYMEGLQYVGRKTDPLQPLEWPRSGAVVDGYYVDSHVIPPLLGRAQMVVALAINSGNDPLAVPEAKVKRSKVDVLEEEYFEPPAQGAVSPDIRAVFRKLLSTGSLGSNQLRVVKG